MVVPAGEVVLDAETNPIDEELLVNGKKETKVKNSVTKKESKHVTEGLIFKNIGVVYKDEIGAIQRERIDLTVPKTEQDWYGLAVRKMLSVWFDEHNISPTEVTLVSLPTNGGEETEISADFLYKPIDTMDKKDIVNCAIYFRCRTVTAATRGDVYEMRQSLFLHLNNLDKLNTQHFADGQSQWVEKEYDPSFIPDMLIK